MKSKRRLGKLNSQPLPMFYMKINDFEIMSELHWMCYKIFNVIDFMKM